MHLSQNIVINPTQAVTNHCLPALAAAPAVESDQAMPTRRFEISKDKTKIMQSFPWFVKFPATIVVLS